MQPHAVHSVGAVPWTNWYPTHMELKCLNNMRLTSIVHQPTLWTTAAEHCTLSSTELPRVEHSPYSHKSPIPICQLSGHHLWAVICSVEDLCACACVYVCAGGGIAFERNRRRFMRFRWMVAHFQLGVINGNSRCMLCLHLFYTFGLFPCLYREA